MKTGDDRMKDKNEKLGDEAPRWKDIIIALIVLLLLIVFSWVTWFKLGWFH